MNDTPARDPRALVGHVLSGRYRVEELIAQGAMGRVYRAEHTHMRKRLAVKVLHPEMSRWSEMAERFQREAIAGAHIQHPNVAAATDFGELEDGSQFLVIEYLDGEDLRSVIARGALPAERAAKIARQIALALRAVHDIGVVHRDLKPENVMLVRKDQDVDVVKLLDFGIAKVPVERMEGSAPDAPALTKLGAVHGTPEYMAPEQALGEDVDARADLYALGVVFYEMLCGARPFEADTRAALLGIVATKRPPRVAARVPGAVVPSQLESIALRLLAKQRTDRFGDADDVLSALDAAISELGFASVAPFAAQARASPARSAVVSLAGLPRESQASTPKSAVTTHGADAVVPRETSRRGLPFPVALATAGAVAVMLVVPLAILLRGSASLAGLSPAGSIGAADPLEPAAAGAAIKPEPPTRVAPRQDLMVARGQGLPALESLAGRYPDDPAVLLALALAHGREGPGMLRALGVVRRLLEISPGSATDHDVERIVRAGAAGAPDASALAFDLMAEKMGAAGPDLLYELALKEPRLKDRSMRLLAKDALLERATPALRIALELRLATPCQAKKPLLARATRDGDARAAAILSPLVAATSRGCGFLGLQPCPAPCAALAAEIRATIQAIESRPAR